MNKKNFIVYKAVNIINNHMYIGKTNDLRVRKLHHKNLKKGIYFSNAIKKYGIDNFIWFILSKTDNEEESLELEKFWINYFKINGFYLYNLTDGGEGISGYKFTKEQCKKLSEANRNINWSKESRLKLSLRLKNNKFRLGKNHTEETKRKMSIATTINNKRNFIDYISLKKILKSYNIQNSGHYKNIYKRIMKENNIIIPRNADQYYNKSWFDILGKSKHWFKNYLDFNIFIFLIKKYNIKSYNDYKNKYKFICENENVVIPCRPTIVYNILWREIINKSYLMDSNNI